jgi:2-oxoglutarate ferredoxin oxidoreductase subunit alpha
MQAKWGTHGDHPVIAVTPSTVPEILSETIRAFNLAEQFRTPVMVLYDEILGHMGSLLSSQPGDFVVEDRPSPVQA